MGKELAENTQRINTGVIGATGIPPIAAQVIQSQAIKIEEAVMMTIGAKPIAITEVIGKEIIGITRITQVTVIENTESISIDKS